MCLAVVEKLRQMELIGCEQVKHSDDGGCNRIWATAEHTIRYCCIELDLTRMCCHM